MANRDFVLNKDQAINSLRSYTFYRQPDQYRFIDRVIPLSLAKELVQECIAEIVDEGKYSEYLRYSRINNDKLIDDAIKLSLTLKHLHHEQFEGVDIIMQLVGKIRQLSSLVIAQNETIEYLKER